jgi:NSS family neurotransmitter:Na+ symporter
MERENFKSRLGFLLVSAGCAIGIGNVWKFPFITGLYGGGVFVLFYLIFLVIMGAPVLTMELAVGRGSRQSVVQGYKALEPVGSKWHLHGWVCIIGCYLLMMYYTTVSGWILDYFFKFLTGTFTGIAEEEVAGVFTGMLANPVEMTAFMMITVAAGILVCSLGLQSGIVDIGNVARGLCHGHPSFGKLCADLQFHVALFVAGEHSRQPLLRAGEQQQCGGG